MTIYTDPEENEDYGFVFPPHGHRPPEIRYPRPRHRHRHHHPLVSTPLGMGPRGPQGETFTFDDLTDEQLAELREDVASVYHRKLESVYTTTGESTSQIPIPWDDFDPEKDMLFVRIEGLWLHANEYTVSEGNIVLTTPIIHAGTAVGITMITTVAMSVEDLESLHGEDGFSPTVSMTRQNNGTLLSITDADGTTSALIPDGAIGPIGQTGPVGPVGPQGPKGDKGDKGDVGPVGPKGQKGDKGDKGDAGLQGPKGDTGDQGPQGVTGPVGPQGEQGPQGIAGNDGTSPLAIDVGTDSIIVHCDSEGKTAKAETTGFDVYAHVGTVTHAVSLTVTCPPHGIPSWLNVYVGSYSVNISWQEGVAAEDALLVLTVSTTNADGDLVTQSYPIHVITILDGAPGVSPTASVERVEGGALVTVTDASGTTTAMLYDATISEGSVTDAMLAPDGIKAQVKSMWGNRLTGELTGEVLTASDAYAAPPLSVGVDGKSTQDGTPTPDAPVPILSVDDLSLVLAGKNLCPAADGSAIASDWVREGQGYMKYIGLIADNATLTLSCTMDGVPSTTGTNNRLYVTISGAQSKFCDLNTAGAKSVTVTGSGIVRMSINHNSVDSYGADTLLKNIQLELGPTATAYEPYQGHIVPFYDGTLRSLPDGTKDTLALSYLRPSTREGWAWYTPTLTKKLHEATFDGSENWVRMAKANSTGYYFAINQDRSNPLCSGGLAIQSIPQLWSHYQHNNPYDASVTDGAVLWRAADWDYNGVRASMPDGIESVADFKTWLASNNVTVLYLLAASTTETLDPIELPILPAPNVNVWCDPSTGLQMEYVRDTNLAYAQLEAALADLATS